MNRGKFEEKMPFAVYYFIVKHIPCDISYSME